MLAHTGTSAPSGVWTASSPRSTDRRGAGDAVGAHAAGRRAGRWPRRGADDATRQRQDARAAPLRQANRWLISAVSAGRAGAVLGISLFRQNERSPHRAEHEPDEPLRGRRDVHRDPSAKKIELRSPDGELRPRSPCTPTATGSCGHRRCPTCRPTGPTSSGPQPDDDFISLGVFDGGNDASPSRPTRGHDVRHHEETAGGVIASIDARLSAVVG